MKLVSYRGYDHMTLHVEESPWWRKILRLSPVIRTYSGSGDNWYPHVSRKKAAALQFLWLRARKESGARIREARR